MGFFPSFRSRRRDTETDVARLVPLLNSVQRAVREAESELSGLIARLRDSGDRAAFLFGTGMESEADSDPKSKAMLKDLEAFLARGGARRRYLQRQVAAFRQVVAILDDVVKPNTSVTDRR